ncbi:MAG: gamma carbonic anhydrase family protein [Thermodesulfobacteriota bacterium]
MNRTWITALNGKIPCLDPEAFVDVSARLIGDVTVEQEASVWPLAVLRADAAGIAVRRRAAVLDLALLEAPEGLPVTIEEEALVSHGAIIHGATVQTRALVGIGAIVLEGAVIGAGSIIGAGSLVTSGFQTPPNTLVLGSPGKVIRELKPEELRRTRDQVEDLYRKSRLLKEATG